MFILKCYFFPPGEISGKNRKKFLGPRKNNSYRKTFSVFKNGSLKKSQDLFYLSSKNVRRRAVIFECKLKVTGF